MLTCTGAGVTGAGAASIAALRTGWATGVLDASRLASLGGVFSRSVGVAGAGGSRWLSLPRSTTVVRDSSRECSTRTVCALRTATASGGVIVGSGDAGDNTGPGCGSASDAGRTAEVSRAALPRGLRVATLAVPPGLSAIAGVGDGAARCPARDAAAICGGDASGLVAVIAVAICGVGTSASAAAARGIGDGGCGAGAAARLNEAVLGATVVAAMSSAVPATGARGSKIPGRRRSRMGVCIGVARRWVRSTKWPRNPRLSAS